MRSVYLMSVLVGVMALPFHALCAEQKTARQEVEDFLARGQRAAEKAVEEFKAPEQPAEPPSPTDVEALKGTLARQGEALFDVAAKLHAEALANLTVGPELATLRAEEEYVQKQMMRLELGLGDVTARIEKERQALAASLEHIGKFYTPGSTQYKLAICREVERRKPRLTMLTKAASTCPEAKEALRDRLARVVTDKAYLEWTFAELAKPSDNLASLLLSGVAGQVKRAEPEKSAEQIEGEFSEAQSWLREQGIGAGAPAGQAPTPPADDADTQQPPLPEMKGATPW